ncbi:MAG: UvrD-helicase domain-containing protein, partial [Paraclostridium sp.]
NYLVLCFNASIKEELIEKAKNKNIKNAEFYTFHGLAYNFFYRNNFIANFQHRELVDNLDVFEVRKIMKSIGIEYSGIRELVDIKNRLALFFTTDLKLGEYFGEDTEPYSTILKYLLKDPEAPLFHSFYIKMFQLLNYNNSKFDTVLVDEAQDMSKCYMSIISNLKVKQVKYFGDAYQMIYGFNGAVGMSTVTHTLDRSFRLGENNAKLCVNILKTLIGEDIEGFQGVNEGQVIVDKLPELEQRTIICRTNKTILKKLPQFKEQNKKCYIIGGKESLGLDTLKRILVDFETKGKTFYKGFVINNEDELINLSRISRDSNLKNIVNAIKELNLESSSDLQRLLSVIVDDRDFADYVMTTVHKCKGLEFKNVEIADDFENMQELIKKKNSGKSVLDEAYVLYVATSRSFGNLKLNYDLRKWLLNPNEQNYNEDYTKQLAM